MKTLNNKLKNLGTSKNFLPLLYLALAMIGFAAMAYSSEYVSNGRALNLTVMSGSFDAASVLGSVTNNTRTSTASAPLPINPNQDLTIMLPAVAAGSSTAPVTAGFNLSPDKSRWTTTLPITATTTLTGATPACNYVVISKTNLVGMAYIRYDSISTTSASPVTVTAPIYSYTTP